MVKKRSCDSSIDMNKKRPCGSTPKPTQERNLLSDGLLNLYKKSSSSDHESQNNEEKQPKSDTEIPKTPAKYSRRGRQALTPTYPTIKFSDVGGMDNIKEDVTWQFIYRKVPKLTAHCNVRHVRGFLLHGPPGSGKTHFVRAMAGEYELPLYEVSATELVCGISGESESKIRDIYEQAIQLGQCILFFDDMDTICPKRDINDKAMERRMVNQMIKCFDELNVKDSSFNVLVVGATNTPDSLEPALKTRFLREYAMGFLDEDARLKILQVLCRKLKFSPGFTIEWLAHNTPGYVGGDLNALVMRTTEISCKRMLKDLFLTGEKDVHSQDAAEERLPGQNEEPSTGKTSLEDVLELNRTLNQDSISDEQIHKLHFTKDDFQVALDEIVPYSKREGFATIPSTTWEDVGALEEVKEVLRKSILRPVKYKKLFDELGLKAGKGFLLYGPKGCGKTLMAKAIANESNINFLSVKGPELMNMYVGESERAVRNCFEKARNSAPCVLFIDEIDALCSSRTSHNENAAADRVVNQFLTEMDGVQDRKQVFVIGATNMLDKIDSAMKRGGRLETLLYVGVPDANGRVEILNAISKRRSKKYKLAENWDLKTIALDPRCENFSGADLEYLYQEAESICFDEIQDTGSAKDFVLDFRHFDKAFAHCKASFSETHRKYFSKVSSNVH